MPGLVTLLTPTRGSGFAMHPRRSGYGVLVHVVHHKLILCSAIADRPPPSNRDRQSHCWFSLNLADFSLSYLDLKALNFLIGETDELLDVSRVKRKAKPSRSAPLVVEDLVLANVGRAWITGATYLDAEEAGVSDANIIELFYMDMFGRRPDPEGLAHYLTHRREGTKSLADIRRELLESEEYANRRKEVAWAPGAIFSQPIVLRLTTAAMEADAASTQQGAPLPGAPVPVDLPERPAAAVLPKVVTRLRPPKRAAGDPRKAEIVDIALAADSALFGAGWYDVEYLDDTPFRWMASEGVIFNPQPELPCTLISLKLAGVYGAHSPMIDCYLDDIAADVRVEEGDGFFVAISPPGSKPQPYTRLRIESRASGCPAAESRGTDNRVLSLNILSARIEYYLTGEFSGA
jgi:hypothetical protein